MLYRLKRNILYSPSCIILVIYLCVQIVKVTHKFNPMEQTILNVYDAMFSIGIVCMIIIPLYIILLGTVIQNYNKAYVFLRFTTVEQWYRSKVKSIIFCIFCISSSIVSMTILATLISDSVRVEVFELIEFCVWALGIQFFVLLNVGLLADCVYTAIRSSFSGVIIYIGYVIWDTYGLEKVKLSKVFMLSGITEQFAWNDGWDSIIKLVGLCLVLGSFNFHYNCRRTHNFK